MMFEDGTRHLAALDALPCSCEVCSGHTAKELRESPERERLLGIHNLAVSFAEMRRVREAIRAGRLWELALARAQTHPALMDGARRALDHAAWIETTEPVSKPSAFFFTGPESARRPEALRVRERMVSRWSPHGRDLFLLPAPPTTPAGEAYADLAPRLRGKDVVPAARSAFGPAPFALDGTYPFAQSVEPAEIDEATAALLARYRESLAAAHGVRILEGSPEAADALPTAEEKTDPLLERVRSVAEYQFGPGAAEALLAGEVSLRTSASTGKVRNVLADGEHVLSLRAEDGLFTLKLAGARRLHEAIEFPRLRIVVNADAVPFVREGKNVFAPFVEKWDATLRPADECLVVDWSDRLVACAQMHLAPAELGWFRRGLAAHVREGVGTSSPQGP
jgi:7-cyano-7-deazaguanine tRNA-ribosyltransferase